MWDLILRILNTEAVQSAIYGLVVYLATIGLGKLWTQKPTWQQYEGTIIAAIKQAEKMIDDDTPNKSLARLDFALKYVLRVAADAGKQLSAADVAEIKDAISAVHYTMENDGAV